MRMGTAQKQNIAVQHRYFNKHGGRQRPTPVSFKEWLQQGIDKYQKQCVTFELVILSLMRIRVTGKVPLLRTASDFERE